MAAPVWEAAKFYPTGFIVRPSSSPAPVVPDITNPNFDGDASGWTLGGSAVYVGAGGFSGPGCVSMSGAVGGVSTDTAVPVVPGQSITATCRIKTVGGSIGNLGDININWYDSGMVQLPTRAEGPAVSQSGGSDWRQTSVTGVAPAGAAFARVQGDASPAGGGSVLFDAFGWNYTPPSSTAGLIYKAVQPELGLSGATEPVWPTTPGLTVVDNEVIWECLLASRVTWEAHPLFVSGPDEPIWPTSPGGSVVNGTLTLTAVPQRVTDENCPNTTVVAMGASKIFAGDGDITRFCATNNPYDWTSPEDAGYLPTGFQEYGANDVGVLNIYRGNLAVMNSEVFQIWQIDPDPALMSNVDQMPAIGSIYQKAAKSVANDLLYLTSSGIRSVGIAGASTNLKAGDVGMPIDELVTAALRAASAIGVKPIGMFYPGLGQYWLCFPSKRGWYPIDEADIEYEFSSTSSLVSFANGVITAVEPAADDPDEPAQWTITTTEKQKFRITISQYKSIRVGTEGGSSITLASSDTAFANEYTNSTFNEDSFAPEVITEDEEPPQADIVYYTPGTDGVTTRVETFRMLVEAFVEGPAETEVFVGDMSGGGKIKWSRYILPFVVEDFTVLGDKLLVRSEDFIVEVDTEYLVDDIAVPGVPPGGEVEEMIWETVNFWGELRWPYLDFGQAGQDKQLLGLDIAGTGTSAFSVGYNQNDFDALTDPLVIPADSLYEGMIPYEVVAPTFSVKLQFFPNQKWRLDALILHLEQ